MLTKPNKRGERATHISIPLKKKSHRELSQTNTNAVNALSMSFYDDSTLNKKKQIILDCGPGDPTGHPLISKNKNSSRNVNKRSVKKIKPSPKYDTPLGKEKDEVDFTTTEASKMVTHDERERRQWVDGKGGKNKGNQNRGSQGGKAKPPSSLSR